MQDIQFPVHFKFKITTIANDFTATDATGKIIAYVRQKMFKLKEDILVYSDESKTKINYRIRADRWLDFSAAYALYDENGAEIGKIVRKGWRSLWRSTYQIIDQYQKLQYTISEENAWTKVFDSLLGEIPLIGMFTGYLFNPSYLVAGMDNEPVIRLKKQPSFWGRNFELIKLGAVDADDDDRIMLGLMMMILLERRRG
jgi:uncharacterized protein YxjI